MFGNLVDYVRTNMNLVDFEVHGRYAVEAFDDGLGGLVRLEVFDGQPQVIHRPGLLPVYSGSKEGKHETDFGLV